MGLLERRATVREPESRPAVMLDPPSNPSHPSSRRTLAGGSTLHGAENTRVVARLIYRFTIAGLLALFLVALGTGIVSRNVGTQQAIADARRIAWLTGTGIVEPALSGGLLIMDAAAIAAVDDVVRRSVLRDSLLRVKIWSADGTVLYSDEPRLIGSTFALDEEELAVLSSGETVAEISDVSRPENQYEASDTELLEVYLPITAPGGERLLYETYFGYEGVTAAGRSAWLSFAVPTLGALLLLELIQIPLALSLARSVRRSQREREGLLRRAIESSDFERRRIASDLHDGIVQDLTGVSFALSAAARTPDSRGREVLARSADQVRASIQSMRSLLVEIHPANLQDEGLEPALDALLAPLRIRGIDTALRVTMSSEPEPGTATLLYRAAQEATRNIIRHSGARSARILVQDREGSVVLMVEDDGDGFDASAARSASDDGHLGLRLLAGLVGDAGGQVAVHSAPGHGTCLTASLPRA